jgi:DNA repair exonuclease SbcCD ATPase subunit
MPRIRNICVKNYRALREFSWNPSPGLNCIVGSGDSGKSTILDCIEIALGLRKSVSFGDSDFYGLDTSQPIEIYVTVGELPDELKNIETYGLCAVKACGTN